MKKTITIFTICLMLIVNSAQCQVWITQNIGSANIGSCFFKVSVIDNNTAWGLLPSNSQVGRTIDGGSNWELWSTPPNQNPTCLQALSSDTAWISTASATDSAKLWKTTDGGQSWIGNARVGIHCDFFHFFNSNDAVVFGDPDSTGWYAYTTSNGGMLWNQVSVPAPLTGENCMDIHYYVFGDNVWTTSTRGRIFYSGDKGNTWNVSTIDSAVFPDIFRVAFCTAQEGIALRHDAFTGVVTNIYRSHDGGISWSITPHTGPVSQSFYGGLLIVPNSNVIISNGDGNSQYGSSYSVDTGATWNVIDSANKYGGIDAKDWNSLWAGQYSSAPGVGGAAKWDGTVLNISDNIFDESLTCYPNPVNDHMVVKSSNKIDEISIIDLPGKYLLFLKCNDSEESVDLNKLAEGIYLIRVKSAGKITTRKFVKP